MNRSELLNRLLDHCEQEGLLRPEDRVYALNRLLALLDLSAIEDGPDSYYSIDPDLPAPASFLEPLLDDAVSRNLIEDYTEARDLLDSRLMDVVMPRPSTVIDQFKATYSVSKEQATDDYYKFSQDSHYIRRDRIEKDKRWKHPTHFGEMDITINLSKPEKDPRAIAAARTVTESSYPLCPLCREAEGYDGRADYPGRANHRIIPLDLDGKRYYLQYSPYVYYNEHSIILNEKHVPMVINRDTFARLAAFVKQFPHYFIGSNADLPIVGGSILSHDHYQGGRYRFAMEDAESLVQFKIEHSPGVQVSILNWPMSVLRLTAEDQSEASETGVIDLAEHILDNWRSYDDREAEIIHETDGLSHNTVTPICRLRDGKLELDLVLRNNRTSEERPLGIFHPHQERHHIKKENIGLIEVMGLAVLPARLLDELEACANSVVSQRELRHDPLTVHHADWIARLNAEGTFAEDETKDDVLNSLYRATGDVFCEVLKDAGVYKQTPEGMEAFRRFIAIL